MASRVVTVRVAEGGALSASLSHENVGEANYVRKTNFRRDKDQEQRREGWIAFKPDATGPDTQDEFDNADTVIRLAELVRPNGDRALIGASRTEIKRFNYSTGLWDTIGSGYSSSGKRWQVTTMDGYLILNNTIDLPTTYRVEEAAVVPMYELREVGVARVGRMEQDSGFILFADITEIAGDQLDPFMDGYSSFTQTPEAKAANFTVASPTDSGKRFDVTTGASTITATLPASPAVGFYFWVKKVDVGAGSITTSPTISSQVPELSAQNNLVLIRWDVINQVWVATNFEDGVVPADAPYGAPPENILNNYPWRIINGEFGKPRNWAPVFSVYMAAASTSLVLPFPSTTFVAGVTRVAVINGGPAGGVLGGQSDVPNGVLVTGVAGNTITLEKTTDTALTYPRVVQVTRWEDTSSLTSSYDLQDSGSQIYGLKKLQNLVIAYRKDGIYVGRYTGPLVDDQGNQTGPFTWRPRYSGFNLPRWGDCIADVNGEYHLYPAEGGRWYMFDGNTNPVVHRETDLARNLFFNNIDDAEYEPWAIENPLTKEWWFFRDGLVFAYDFEYKTVSIIDAQIDASVFCLRPESTDRWFVLGIENLIMTYGLVEGENPIHTWLRAGEEAVPSVKSGLISFNDQFNEKIISSFVPVLSTLSGNVECEVQLYACWNPSVTPVALLVPPETLPDPEGENLLACFYQSLYFQHELTFDGEVDEDIRLSGVMFEMEKVMAGRVNTRVNQ